MKRLISLLGMIAAIVTILALPVVPAEAAPPGCFCGGYEYTPQDWAQASTCAQATTNLRNQAYAYIDCPDGSCSRVLVLTAGCHWDTYNGAWQVDGYVRYQCWWCDN